MHFLYPDWLFLFSGRNYDHGSTGCCDGAAFILGGEEQGDIGCYFDEIMLIFMFSCCMLFSSLRPGWTRSLLHSSFYCFGLAIVVTYLTCLDLLDRLTALKLMETAHRRAGWISALGVSFLLVQAGSFLYANLYSLVFKLYISSNLAIFFRLTSSSV